MKLPAIKELQVYHCLRDRITCAKTSYPTNLASVSRVSFSSHTQMHPHPHNTHTHTSPLHTVPATRTQLQLWQFLLELLLVSPNAHLIQWTDAEFEFQINKPTEVAQLWGKCTNNPSMNYEKLARGLRYYYQKGIMNKVSGRKLTFKYAGSVRDYVKMRRSQIPASHKELVAME